MTIQVTAFTENRGNGYVVNKLTTTRFPPCALVMELAAQVEIRKVRMEAEWTPRERNQEADDLSNLLTNHFDPSKEVQIELEGQSWLVLPALLQSGHRFQEQKELEIEQREKEEQGRKRMKRKKEEKLKFRERW